MSQLLLTREPVCAPVPDALAPLDIITSIQMEAEVPRLLHALAMPEYMEAWMRMPGADRIECNPDQRSFDRFRIDLFSSGRFDGSIHGACLLSKPNKITYLWEKEGASIPVQSIVEIRLWSYLDHCVLKLRHSGFSTRDDWKWHARMWDLSLDKLRALMEGTAPSHQDHAAIPS